MFTAILSIAGVLALVAVAAWFFAEYGAKIAEMWSWALETIQGVTATFPDWVLPFVLIALVLAVISLLVKLL